MSHEPKTPVFSTPDDLGGPDPGFRPFDHPGHIGSDLLTMDVRAGCVMIVVRTQGKQAPFAMLPEEALSFAEQLIRASTVALRWGSE